MRRGGFMNIKFVVAVCNLTILLVVNPAFALRPSLTPKAMDVRTEAIKLLEKHDYSRLEELLKLNLKNGDRVDDGQWKLHIAMDGIDGNAAQFLGDAATVEKIFALVSDWTAKYPESKMAKIALANAW